MSIEQAQAGGSRALAEEASRAPVATESQLALVSTGPPCVSWLGILVIHHTHAPPLPPPTSRIPFLSHPHTQRVYHRPPSLTPALPLVNTPIPHAYTPPHLLSSSSTANPPSLSSLVPRPCVMQRGTVRRRSSSDSGDTAQRPSQRHRTSANSSLPPSSPQPSLTTTVTSESAPRTMGPPVSSNGTGNGVSDNVTPPAATTSDRGPFTLPRSVIEQVQVFRPSGHLAYPDDKDWAINHDAEFITDDSQAAEGEASRARAMLRKQVFGRRMPIDREEIVRLMLQGLHDIGYQYVAFPPSLADAPAKLQRFSPRSLATHLRRAQRGTLKPPSSEGVGQRPTHFFLPLASRPLR